MRKRIAIVDVPKSGGNPVLSFPAGTVTKKRGKRLRVHYRNNHVFAQVLLSNTNRWVALVVAPQRAFTWLENRLGADVYELTWKRWQNNKTALAFVGLVGEIIDGEEVLRLPHVICGQSPFIRNPNP